MWRDGDGRCQAVESIVVDGETVDCRLVEVDGRDLVEMQVRCPGKWLELFDGVDFASMKAFGLVFMKDLVFLEAKGRRMYIENKYADSSLEGIAVTKMMARLVNKHGRPRCRRFQILELAVVLKESIDLLSRSAAITVTSTSSVNRELLYIALMHAKICLQIIFDHLKDGHTVLDNKIGCPNYANNGHSMVHGFFKQAYLIFKSEQNSETTDTHDLKRLAMMIHKVMPNGANSSHTYRSYFSGLRCCGELKKNDDALKAIANHSLKCLDRFVGGVLLKDVLKLEILKKNHHIFENERVNDLWRSYTKTHYGCPLYEQRPRVAAMNYKTCMGFVFYNDNYSYLSDALILPVSSLRVESHSQFTTPEGGVKPLALNKCRPIEMLADRYLILLKWRSENMKESDLCYLDCKTISEDLHKLKVVKIDHANFIFSRSMTYKNTMAIHSKQNLANDDPYRIDLFRFKGIKIIKLMQIDMNFLDEVKDAIGDSAATAKLKTLNFPHRCRQPEQSWTFCSNYLVMAHMITTLACIHSTLEVYILIAINFKDIKSTKTILPLRKLHKFAEYSFSFVNKADKVVIVAIDESTHGFDYAMIIFKRCKFHLLHDFGRPGKIVKPIMLEDGMHEACRRWIFNKRRHTIELHAIMDNMCTTYYKKTVLFKILI